MKLPAIQRDGLPDIVRQVRERTPARLLVGRSGAAYPTAAQLQLRADHAAAKDAVEAELDLERDLGADVVKRFQLFEVATRASSKAEYLRYPDRGRRFGDESRQRIAAECPHACDLQVAIGDGLSVAAVREHAGALLSLLATGAEARSWTFGRPFVIRHGRVGILNDIGEILRPQVVVLLIGERPGLATASSLSAYIAYQPRAGNTDADRNLVSNIHARGIVPADAVVRILHLAEAMMKQQLSGYRLQG